MNVMADLEDAAWAGILDPGCRLRGWDGVVSHVAVGGAQGYESQAGRRGLEAAASSAKSCAMSMFRANPRYPRCLHCPSFGGDRSLAITAREGRVSVLPAEGRSEVLVSNDACIWIRLYMNTTIYEYNIVSEFVEGHAGI